MTIPTHIEVLAVILAEIQVQHLVAGDGGGAHPCAGVRPVAVPGHQAAADAARVQQVRVKKGVAQLRLRGPDGAACGVHPDQ